MEPLLLFPDPAPPELAQALDLAATRGRPSADETAVTRRRARRRLGRRHRLRRRRPRRGLRPVPGAAQAGPAPSSRSCCWSSGTQLGELELREDLFDDFCLTPFHPRELEARLAHLFWRTGRGTRPELVEYGDLVLNLETYQAAIAGQPLDLTYMEYELLKFLATHPGKVFTRETLLIAGVGLRVLRRGPHRRRPRPPPAGQARRGARQPDLRRSARSATGSARPAGASDCARVASRSEND